MNNLSKTQKTLSTIFKIVVFLSTLIGVILSVIASETTFMGSYRAFMYFTIQSNIAIAIIEIIGIFILWSKKPIGKFWYIIKLVFTVSITLTFAVFTFVLAPTFAHAWSIPNVLTHLVTPIVSIIDFFFICYEYEYKKLDVLFVTLPPLAYSIYATIAYISKWEFAPKTYYPYFFLNWGSEAGAFGFSTKLPFMGCVYWILLLLLFILGIGFLFVFILKIIKKKHTKT